MIDGVHKFQLSHNAFWFDFFCLEERDIVGSWKPTCTYQNQFPYR